MATELRDGWRDWRLQRDREGHRNYRVKFVVTSTDRDDGPETVLSTAGLPTIGSTWIIGNDSDPYAYCSPEVTVTPEVKKEFGKVWILEYTFTTKPLFRCQTTNIEDPLAEPEEISGSFVNYVKEATQDRFGNRLKTSSHEQLRGAIVEFDAHRHTVEISENVASLELPLVGAMMNTLNTATLWGLPPRTVKLSRFTWTRKVQGTCSYYYTRKFGFDIDTEGFDRTAMDEGTMVLKGRWGIADEGEDPNEWILLSPTSGGIPTGTAEEPDPDNPSHFIVYTDRNDQATTVILDGNGQPANLSPTGTGGDNPGQIQIEYYRESDFTLLGIPTSF